MVRTASRSTASVISGDLELHARQAIRKLARIERDRHARGLSEVAQQVVDAQRPAAGVEAHAFFAQQRAQLHFAGGESFLRWQSFRRRAQHLLDLLELRGGAGGQHAGQDLAVLLKAEREDAGTRVEDLLERRLDQFDQVRRAGLLVEFVHRHDGRLVLLILDPAQRVRQPQRAVAFAPVAAVALPRKPVGQMHQRAVLDFERERNRLELFRRDEVRVDAQRYAAARREHLDGAVERRLPQPQPDVAVADVVARVVGLLLPAGIDAAPGALRLAFDLDEHRLGRIGVQPAVGDDQRDAVCSRPRRFEARLQSRQRFELHAAMFF
jgi:hypothetical protein